MHRALFLVGAVSVGGCYLSHERAPDAAVTDAFVQPDAFHSDAFRRDAFVVPVDAALPDAWSPPPPTRCVDAADQRLRPPPDRSWFEHIAAIDLDGDGSSELVALGRDMALTPRPSVHVFRSAGGALGEVWRTRPTDAYDYPYGLSGSDIDQDGDLDLLTSLGGLRVFENRAGTLVERGVVSSSLVGSHFEADDLEGDGDIDVAAGTATATLPAEHLVTQEPDGSFTDSMLPGGTGSASVQMLRRGDAWPELVVAAEVYAGVFRVFERVEGSWGVIASSASSARLSGLAADDFDGDGLEDFVVMRFHHEGPWFYRQRPGGVFERTMEGNPAIGYSALVNAWARSSAPDGARRRRCGIRSHTRRGLGAHRSRSAAAIRPGFALVLRGTERELARA